MIEPKNVTAVLLAAGRATRFGGDKLRAPIGGIAIAERAAAALRGIGFARLLVVVGAHPLELAGFEPVAVAPGLPMSASLAAAARAAEATSCQACLIALADMPFVSPRHIAALLTAHVRDITASAGMGRPMVPAIFDRAHFNSLTALEGDRGARALLRTAILVPAAPDELVDIDEPQDLARFG